MDKKKAMNAFDKWVKARNEQWDMFDYCACDCQYKGESFPWETCDRCHDYLYNKEKAAQRHSVLRAFKVHYEVVLIAIMTAALIIKSYCDLFCK